MLGSLYIETTIISYLVSRTSSDERISAMQNFTKEWWSKKRFNYDILISEAVLDEIKIGDRQHVEMRLEIVKDIPVISQTTDIINLSKNLTNKNIVPPKAKIDALHISYAAMSGVDALVTWNCKHLANINTQKALYRYLAFENIECPIICTPLELLEN